MIVSCSENANLVEDNIFCVSDCSLGARYHCVGLPKTSAGVVEPGDGLRLVLGDIEERSPLAVVEHGRCEDKRHDA